MDEYILRHAPGPTVEPHPAIGQLRPAVAAAMATLTSVPDAAMESPWMWDGHEADVRYGFYRLYEMLEATTAQVAAALPDAQPSAARSATQAATRARWDLHGLLASVTEEDLDAEPGGGEWTVRLTLAHIINSQRGYAWGNAWWLERRTPSIDAMPPQIPDEEFIGFPEEASEGVGSSAAIRARFDDVLDAVSSRYATLTPDELAVNARWSGIPVDIRFRVWRWSSHIREHTVQVEKTLTMLGRQPTEAERLVRLAADAYGSLEAQLFCLPANAVETALGDASSAAQVLTEIPGHIARLAKDVALAARDTTPRPA